MPEWQKWQEKAFPAGLGLLLPGLYFCFFNDRQVIFGPPAAVRLHRVVLFYNKNIIEDSLIWLNNTQYCCRDHLLPRKPNHLQQDLSLRLMGTDFSGIP